MISFSWTSTGRGGSAPLCLARRTHQPVDDGDVVGREDVLTDCRVRQAAPATPRPPVTAARHHHTLTTTTTALSIVRRHSSALGDAALLVLGTSVLEPHLRVATTHTASRVQQTTQTHDVKIVTTTYFCILKKYVKT